MSKVTDIWGDTISIDVWPKVVTITSDEERHCAYGCPSEDVSTTMELDADQAHELIKKLKKALDEMEGM